MPFRLEIAQEDDILRIIEIRFLNAQHDAYERIMFPKDLPAGARTVTIQRFRSALLDDPSCTVLEIVDGESQQIVAFAIWVIHDEGDPGNNNLAWKRSWDVGTNQEAADDLVTAIVTKKRQLVAGKPHCYLDLLEVDPKWQRKGAGKLLLQWGLDQAMRLTLPCYLESTPAGLPLYRNRGFKEQDVIDLSMTKWGVEGTSRYVCLMRPAPT